MTDELIEQIKDVQRTYEKAGLHGENGAEIMKNAAARILADAEKIAALEAKVKAFLKAEADCADAPTVEQMERAEDALDALKAVVGWEQGDGRNPAHKEPEA